MSIVYPLSLPSYPGPRVFKLGQFDNIGSSMGEFDLQEQTQDWQGQRWLATLTYAPMKRSQAEPICAVLSALYGISGTLLLPVFNASSPQGTATSATVNGVHAAHSKIVNVTMIGTLKAGDYLQINEQSGSPLMSYARLHKVLTDASGNSALDIWPRLRGALNGGESVILVNPVGTFRLAENKREWSVDEARHYGISFNLREAL